MRRIFALLMLLVLGFSLSAGAHPCGAETAPGSEARPAAQEAPPCHGMKMPKAAPPAHSGPQADTVSAGEGKGCCDPRQADHPCVHACHLVAVSSALPAAFSVVPVAAVQAVSPGIALRNPARSIDHIPLS